MERESPDQVRCGPDPFIWAIPLVLTGLGILMISSTTSYRSLALFGNPFVFGLRQLQFLGIGLTAMVMTYMIPLGWLRRLTAPFWVLALVFTWLSLAPLVGHAAGGASRWLRLGPFSFQPFELLSLASVAHLANRLTVEELTPKRAFTRTLLLLSLSVLPVLLQPDLGGTLLLTALCMGLYVDHHGWRYPLGGGAGLALIVTFLIRGENYRLRRIWAFLDPWKDPRDSGFQVIQGLVAFANGGFWGVGLGKGFQKLHYLPASDTDFIFAVLAEELGFPGTALVLSLFAFWAFRVMKLARTQTDSFFALLVWGLGLSVLLPMIINVGGVTKLLPLTGMPLPFLSYGGSSLVSMWIKIGLLLGLAKESGREGVPQ
ncbi:cell division protein FtsW [Aminithiophilus ramosus]|uniref:Cell division protein FtsW n=2 Tax=Synergistales TaxID=649776 RepID=A0ACD1DZ71_9BACT|nr:putative peptidoglycan glycosyltransferase FtsW [Aminithiophilus ramosus]QTX33535.1 cell division protein FtsW [Aminithiophilus ramosus]QVL37390.1 cell division protein FtsW [Synergistota bacterium]